MMFHIIGQIFVNLIVHVHVFFFIGEEKIIEETSPLNIHVHDVHLEKFQFLLYSNFIKLETNTKRKMKRKKMEGNFLIFL
jgi:hypothetical protein